MKCENLSGKRFGKLLAVSLVEGKWERAGGRHLCRCDCGKEKIIPTNSLKTGNSKSCGCMGMEALYRGRYASVTHGMSRTKVFQSWRAMMHRCYNRNQGKSYERYGGRGIKVCEFLRGGPYNLQQLIGDRPDRMTLDRKDNNGNYSCGKCQECLSNHWPVNVKWSTVSQQQRNRRVNHLITIKGETRCMKEWAERAGIGSHVILHRLKRGDFGEALLRKPIVRKDQWRPK